MDEILQRNYIRGIGSCGNDGCDGCENGSDGSCASNPASTNNDFVMNRSWVSMPLVLGDGVGLKPD